MAFSLIENFTDESRLPLINSATPFKHIGMQLLAIIAKLFRAYLQKMICQQYRVTLMLPQRQQLEIHNFETK